MPTIERLEFELPLELWSVELDGPLTTQELARLSTDEHARASRFVFDRDRFRYLNAHVALRALLSRRTGVPAVELVFRTGAFGKPSLVVETPCAFNLSDSADLALVLLGGEGDECEIGVDLEVLRRVPDATALAQQNFTADECRELERMPADERDLAFLRGWTRKEACLKALGSGLSIAPETFETGLMPNPRQVFIPTAAGVREVNVRSLAENNRFVGAVAQLL